MEELRNQPCMMCEEPKATLREDEVDIPHFGKVYVLSITCEGCGYRKSDLEPAEKKDPCSYTLEVSTEEDLSAKVIKSGEATVKIPHVITIEAGPASSGYITNIEGLLERVKKVIESAADAEEDDPVARKKAKRLIKKLNNVLLAREPLKITISDPSGHSAIISSKAVKKKA